jgi:hypothetical protein
MQLAQATIVPSTLPEVPLMLVDDGSTQGWPGHERFTYIYLRTCLAEAVGARSALVFFFHVHTYDFSDASVLLPLWAV